VASDFLSTPVPHNNCGAVPSAWNLCRCSVQAKVTFDLLRKYHDPPRFGCFDPVIIRGEPSTSYPSIEGYGRCLPKRDKLPPKREQPRQTGPQRCGRQHSAENWSTHAAIRVHVLRFGNRTRRQERCTGRSGYLGSQNRQSGQGIPARASCSEIVEFWRRYGHFQAQRSAGCVARSGC